MARAKSDSAKKVEKPVAIKIIFDDFKSTIVVRLNDYGSIENTKVGREWINQTLSEKLSHLEQEFGSLKLIPKFSDAQLKTVRALAQRGIQLDKDYRPANFAAFYDVEAPNTVNQVALVKQLLRFNEIKSAYIDHAGPDPVVSALDDPRFVNQGYLDPAPDGIDAEYAWTYTGGDGAGQRFIDLERGWTLDHEDIITHGGSLLHGTLLDTSRAHGTSVLGEICAVDNTHGCVGIVPNIDSFDVVSFNGSSRSAAILTALENLNFGDVLLLEAQVYLNGTTLLGPIEAYDAEYEAIRLATSLGIIVVEAGGNGTNNGLAPALDMDTYATLGGLQILNPANPNFRDSGAIIVTAATSTSPHVRRDYGPYGARIDCYAWSQNIDTLDSDSTGSTNLYRTNFSGTSGASPIIVGAALAVQGIMEAQHGYRFGPLQMRALLSNPAFGTPPAATETTAIGVMPNLKAIIDNAIDVAHDVYIRDNLGDVGEPHTGSISTSPDIILRPDAVANPQMLYGAGSGNENNALLGYEIEKGQDNFIYTRVLNQGGVDATNVQITLYWSEVSTLVTPDMWTLIGNTTIPIVPSGEILTVSDAIVWEKGNLPAQGHYCIVGIIGTDSDPAPLPADFSDWTNFQRFIRDNNNVTWRNFNVVDNEPDDPELTIANRGFKALPFISPGAPDIGRKMNLEIQANLPLGALVYLEAPQFYAGLIGQGAIKRMQNNNKNVVLLPVKRNGKHIIDEVLYPAKIKAKMRLLVHIPEQYRNQNYDIAVKQLYEKQEVGRVTFRMTDTKKRRSRFEVYKDNAGEFRWRLLTANNNIIADSGEGYKNKADCIHGLNLVKAVGPDLPVVNI